MLHRAARSAIEFAGSPNFLNPETASRGDAAGQSADAGAAQALARPTVDIGGVRHELSDVPIAWERALGWIPTFTCTIADLVLRGTIFAPYGRDADVSGAVYALSIESRAKADVNVTVTLAGALGHRQLRVRTPRAFEDAPRVALGASGAVLLEGSSLPGLASLALLADADAETSVEENRYSIRRTLAIAAGGREQMAFYLAVGPERDGAKRRR